MNVTKLLALILLFLSHSVSAVSVNYHDHLRYVELGWKKLMASDVSGCIELWDQQSISILSESRNSDAFLAAGFLQVLITSLYEKTNNDKAYQNWLTAKSYFLYSKVAWKDYSKGMRDYFVSSYLQEKDSMLEDAIKIKTRPAAKVESSDLSLFLAIETALAISQFKGPKQGLSSQQSSNGSIPTRGLVGRAKLKGILHYENTHKYAVDLTESSTQVNASDASMIGGSNRGGTQASLKQVRSDSKSDSPDLMPAVLTMASSSEGSDLEQSWFLEAMDESLNGVNPWLIPQDMFATQSSTDNSSESTLGEIPLSENILIGQGSQVGHVEPLTIEPDGSIRPVLAIPDNIENELPLNAEGSSINGEAENTLELSVPSVMAFRGQTGVKAQEKLPILVSAKRAWQYFDRNIQPTGMVNASDHYDYTDIWSMGSSLAAIISAFKLEVIDQEIFDDIIARFLTTLLEMPLYRGILPNNLYHTRNGTMVNPNNDPTDVGSDWNAVGLGRLLIWLKLLVNWYPAYNDTVSRIIDRFDLTQAFNDEGLHRAEYVAGVEKAAIDTTLGYAHYAQFGFALWGRLGSIPDISTYPETAIYTIPIRYDENKQAHLVSDPFFLAQMEIDGLSDVFLKQSLRVYQVQKAHSFTQKKPIVFTELNLDKPPWFIYLNIFHNDTAWQALDFSGKPYPEHLAYSTHGLFMMDAIFNDDYSQQWVGKASGFGYLDYGFPSGRRYNGIPIHSYTANTNGIILQSLLYQHVIKKPFSAN